MRCSGSLWDDASHEFSLMVAMSSLGKLMGLDRRDIVAHLP